MAADDQQALEQETRSALLYSIGRICDTEIIQQENCNMNQSVPRISREALSVISELALQQLQLMSTDLRLFAHHAGRKAVNVDDVLLYARKSQPLVCINLYSLYKIDS